RFQNPHVWVLINSALKLLHFFIAHQYARQINQKRAQSAASSDQPSNADRAEQSLSRPIEGLRYIFV
ncbi:hypothetical protein, partial [Paramuribaculum intestinale]|uniref:hypothetical protein n=2 Tax=Bacteroidales TaxID=171549 RepID=UPI00272C3F68